MKVMLTAFNRPQYLREVLDSWSDVRGIERTEFLFALDRSPQTEENADLLRYWIADVRPAQALVRVAPTNFGVSKNPYLALSSLFDSGAKYVLATEDDVIVSDDIIEYHEWARDEYRNDQEIATVCSFTTVGSADTGAVDRRPVFSALGWGTWSDRWYSYVGKEWDVDVVHFTGEPGVEAGWDWHLVKRIMAPRDLKSIFPHNSRTNHIGVYGVHSVPECFAPSTQYHEHYEPTTFHEVAPDLAMKPPMW